MPTPRTYDDRTEEFAATFAAAPADHAPLRRNDWTWLVLAIGLAVAGAALTYVAWRSFAGSLPRNAFVGIRTGSTMATEAAWRRAHDAAAPWTLLQGIVLFGAAAWLATRRPTTRRAHAVGAFAVAAFLALLLVAVEVADTAAVVVG